MRYTYIVWGMNDHVQEAKKLLLLGDRSSAKNIFKKLVSKNLDLAEALHGLGYIDFQEGKLDSALKFLTRAAKVEEDNPDIHNSLGIVYLAALSWENAAASFENVKKILEKLRRAGSDPKYINVVLKLSEIYIKQQKYKLAKPLLKKIPKNLLGLKLLAQVYVAELKYYLAIETLEQMPVDQSVKEALKAEVFLLKQDTRNALKCAHQAVLLEPHNPQYLGILGECYIKSFELEKSIDAYKKALAIDPLNGKFLSRLLALQVRVCDWDGRESVIRQLRREEKNFQFVQPTIAILAGFSNKEIQKVANIRCQAIEDVAKPVREGMGFQSRRSPRKKIKIGYLSSDFYDHATAHLMLDIFALHDRKKFEILAYSYGKNDKSYLRKKIQNDCDRFFDIGKISDLAAAKQIYEDGIDILVDLKGHIVDHRLGILALRPAPCQVHYLGYPGTIGASFVDYLIADPFLIPKSERKYYSESLVYLPDTYQANTATKIMLKKGINKALYKIPENHFVYCCFNQNDKFDTETVNAWMKILQAAPKSILWVWGNYHEMKKKLDALGKKWGIQAERFIVSPTEPHPKHLARMQLADLFLDTFYYNAHTSCSDALRVGLPILTNPGKTFASRVAASLIKRVKANQLIAKGTEDYIKKALHFAENPGKLKRIQETINQNRDASGIYDPVVFTKHLDMAFLKMWEVYQSGKPPRDITV